MLEVSSKHVGKSVAERSKQTQNEELVLALNGVRAVLGGVIAFSVVINLLMLTGPLYMLQVYDRVLLSGSIPTLIALTMLMVAMYTFMGLLDFLRSRVLVRVGKGIEQKLLPRAFEIWTKQQKMRGVKREFSPLKDLTAVKSFWAGPAPSALFDIPWAPIYIIVIWMLHWMLGVAALVGAIILLLIALMGEFSTRRKIKKSHGLILKTQSMASSVREESKSILAMGMFPDLFFKYRLTQNKAATLELNVSDTTQGYSAIAKAFRMTLQSSILGLGCALAVSQIISPGAMIAASIIMGRAMAPVQMAIGQWKSFVKARDAYERLNVAFEMHPEEKTKTSLPAIVGRVSLKNVTAAPPGVENAVLKDISFDLLPGQGLAVIGPSASGKSTLASLLVGTWIPQRGALTIDGASFQHWNLDDLGKSIGYLSQNAKLLDGSIKDNISRFQQNSIDSDVVAAAKNAGVHEMILTMENGYETVVGSRDTVLSGGQIQRIALARSLFGNPKLLVLDEPNSNLDVEGDAALSKAILIARKKGTTVVVMTHRPSAVASLSHMLVLKSGRIEQYGLKDEVIRKMQEIANINGNSN